MKGKGGIKPAERLDTPTYDELVSIVRSHEEMIRDIYDMNEDKVKQVLRDIYDRTEDKVKQEGAKILLSADMAETALICAKWAIQYASRLYATDDVVKLKELLEAAGVSDPL